MLFFFNDPATTEICTLSLHDALPIFGIGREGGEALPHGLVAAQRRGRRGRDHGAVGRQRLGYGLVTVIERPDRKSTRLNSSHANISYALFCLKKTTIFP